MRLSCLSAFSLPYKKSWSAFYIPATRLTGAWPYAAEGAVDVASRNGGNNCNDRHSWPLAWNDSDHGSRCARGAWPGIPVGRLRRDQQTRNFHLHVEVIGRSAAAICILRSTCLKNCAMLHVISLVTAMCCNQAYSRASIPDCCSL